MSSTARVLRGTRPRRWARNSSARTDVLLSISTRSMGDGGDFGEHGAADGVGEGEGGVGEDKVDGRVVGLAGVSEEVRVV